MPTGYRPNSPLPSGGQTTTGGVVYSGNVKAGSFTTSSDAPATPVADTIYSNSQFKFWAFVTVTAGVPALTEKFNVSSITDNGVGDFTLNFATALDDDNFCIAGTGFNAGGQINITPYSQTASLVSYQAVNSLDIVSDVTHEVLGVGR